jgi:hypothetical protein
MASSSAILSIMDLIVTISINDTQHNITHSVTIAVFSECRIFYSYAKCHPTECLFGDCCHAECHHANCRHAECHHAERRHAECHHAECHHAEGHYTERRYAECHGVIKRLHIIMHVDIPFPGKSCCVLFFNKNNILLTKHDSLYPKKVLPCSQ